MKNTNNKAMEEIEITVERFKLDEGNLYFPILKFTLDDHEITYKDLVKYANQLASALNDRGCHFEVFKNESKNV